MQSDASPPRATKHQAYPAAAGGTQAVFAGQLSQYTDLAGVSSAAKDAAHSYGPYLRKVPPLPVGSKKGLATVKVAPDTDLPGGGAEAWIYYPSSGEIKANLADAEADPKGTAYNQY